MKASLHGGRRCAALLLPLLVLSPTTTEGRPAIGVPATLTLDGKVTQVRWTDGDSFQVDSGSLRGLGTRVVGYNALETFGPVHRIGTLGPAELQTLARASAPLLARTAWRCTTTGARDQYGRPLVACPEAARLLVSEGQAMVYALGGPADPALLVAQRGAQARKVGMWAGGVPREIVTSLHSATEGRLGRRGAYDRLVDTRTGATRQRFHERRYATCQEVCVGEAPLSSCLVYVPFEQRYRRRPPCLDVPAAARAPARAPGPPAAPAPSAPPAGRP